LTTLVCGAIIVSAQHIKNASGDHTQEIRI
jgi:hypothetical protein